MSTAEERFALAATEHAEAITTLHNEANHALERQRAELEERADERVAAREAELKAVQLAQAEGKGTFDAQISALHKQVC